MIIEILLFIILIIFLFLREKIINLIKKNNIQKELIFVLLLFLVFYNLGKSPLAFVSLFILIGVFYNQKCIKLGRTLCCELEKFEKLLDEEQKPTDMNLKNKKTNKKIKKQLKIAKKIKKIKEKMKNLEENL